MGNFLKNLFLRNWLRKLISIIIAIIAWFAVDHSLTTTKVITTVGIRITNIPKGKAIVGLQPTGLLNKRVTLTLTGKKGYVEEVNSNDLEIVVDASEIHSDESIIEVQKKHLVSLNPDFNISRHVNKVAFKNIILKSAPLSEEKIPIYIANPIGESPKGFQFLDIWPYHLTLTASGPEEAIKTLKNKGLKLTLNLNNISKVDLEKADTGKQKDVVSFYIPEEWKVLSLPSIAEDPIKITDPEARLLRIDFIRAEYIPIKFKIPLNIFIPPDHDPEIETSLSIKDTGIVSSIRDVKVINKELFVKGVSPSFVKIIKDMVTISINVKSITNSEGIDWYIQFINPTILEDRYVSAMMADVVEEDIQEMHPRLRQEYFRNRFRNYMNRFRLFTGKNKPLNLGIEVNGKDVLISEKIRERNE